MSRTIAVTGGSGKLGRAVVTALTQDGWKVANFDRVPRSRQPRPFRPHRFDRLRPAVDLPCLPGCRAARGAERDLGVQRDVAGLPVRPAPAYVPFDEAIPPTPEVVYSLGKDLEEEMARQYCRWQPEQKMIGLRFSNVMVPAEYADFPGFEQDPGSRKWNLWSSIDARDGTQAVLKALAYDKPGFDNFVIANADTVMIRPSTELMTEFFPGTEFLRPVDGTQTLCSINKALTVLGWAPQHSWRDHASEPAS